MTSICLLFNNRKSARLLFFILIIQLTDTQAGGLQINYQSLRQTGMANTGVGLAMDASSIFINPGALVMNYRGGILLGSSALIPNTIFLEAPPSDYLDTTQRFVFTPIYLYAAFKGKPGSKWEKFSLGISLNNPFGGRAKWDDDWKGQNISREFFVNTFFLQPTLSYQISENIGVGAGLSYGFTSLLSRKTVTSAGGGSAQYTGIGTSLGFNLGIFAQVTKEVSIGISYRSPFKVEISKGLVQFSVPTSLEESFPDQAFQTEFTLPRVLSFGLGYKPNERTQFAVDMVFTGWEVFDSLNLKLTDPSLVSNNFPTRNYANSVSIRAGGEYALSDAFLFRAGIFYDGSPIPSDNLSPEFPDANRIGLSAGIGYRFRQKITIDFASTYDFTGERTASYPEGGFAGTYLGKTYTFGLGVGYLF